MVEVHGHAPGFPPTREETLASATALLVDLNGWTMATASFHGDRQLADRVLLACGWDCQPDRDHPAGVKWLIGSNPQYTVWEPLQPHPVMSLEDAFRQAPYDWRVTLMQRGYWEETWAVKAQTRSGFSVEAVHPSLPIALSMACVQAWFKALTPLSF